VDADGTGLHQVPIPGCGGPRSAPISSACYDPGWSPDGSRIVFSRTTVSSAGATVSNIYTSDPDGSHVFQVTHQRSGFQVTASDWGTRRVTGANPPDRRTSRRW
jgi:hypothetical protein